MGTLHLVVNVLCFLFGPRPGTGCLLGWSFTVFLTLAPHDYVICCPAQGLSGHTSPRGECAEFFLDDYMPIEEY